MKIICQPACKPGSVNGARPRLMTIHLGQTLPKAQATNPDEMRKRIWSKGSARSSYLVLLRMGFTLPHLLPRCAVRSYRTLSPLPAKSDQRPELTGGILSAALSLRFSSSCASTGLASLAGISPASCFPGARTFLSGPKTKAIIQPAGIHRVLATYQHPVKPKLLF